MSDNKWAGWASRKGGRPSQGQQAQTPTQMPGQQPVNPPPEGYAWVMHPQFGMALVPLASLAAVASPAPPVRQPGTTPFVMPGPFVAQPQTRPGRLPAPPSSTNMLVKPGNADPYADLLATLPDLIPDPGYDAMAGQPNPAVQQELARFSEFRDVGFAADPSAPAVAFTGAAPRAHTAPLGTAVPKPSSEE